MTVAQAMKKFHRKPTNTRIYVRELETEVNCHDLSLYYDDEVVNIWPHNGDMVCEVAKARYW